MTSHKFAQQLSQLAEFLLGRNEFLLPDHEKKLEIRLSYYGTKEPFIAAAKATGGRKVVDEKYLEDKFQIKTDTPDFLLALMIDRNKVCRIVKPAQEAVYDCEPLLSAEDESELEGEKKA